MRKLLVYFVVADGLQFQVPDNMESVLTISDCQVVIAYGGDGTVLKAFGIMSKTNNLNKPLFGINKGTLGFMSNDVETMESVIHDIIDEPSTNNLFDQRALLDVELLYGGTWKTYRALNELSIHTNNIGRLLDVNMKINSYMGDSGSVTLKGDGLIVATSTGSTAYNLSAGGPILMPYMRSMVVTPLAPFTMSGRPIILGERDNLELEMGDVTRMTIDGKEIRSSHKVCISISQDNLILIRLGSFFEAIQHKLGWNKSIK